MRRAQTGFVVAVMVLSSAVPAAACLWDYDTLAVERSAFPSVLELITGKFLRHSPEFYEWRIQDRTKRIASEPDNVALYDDLAVAYHKVGQNDKAIATMLEKEQRHPGIYETYSNLGTFYIFTGELEKAVEQIGKAIEINPDAHFGREVYQKLLVEYALSKQSKDGGKITLPLTSGWRGDGRTQGFAAFVASKLEGKQNLSDDGKNRAISGVLGMMRFANHDNPLLLEALGDLLMVGGPDDRVQYGDAKNLAGRAYLLASYRVDDEKARSAYVDLVESAVAFQTEFQYQSSEGIPREYQSKFDAELAEAANWYDQVRNDELAWIAAGDDVDARFTAKYYNEPAVSGPIGASTWGGGLFRPPITTKKILIVLGILVTLSAIVAVSAYFFVRLLLRPLLRDRRNLNPKL